MINYSVSKQYGHIVQIWDIKAENELDAWDKAETEGRLVYQTTYRQIHPLMNYVTNTDTNSRDNITQDEYKVWLEEAFSLGMKVDGYSGLPFNDV